MCVKSGNSRCTTEWLMGQVTGVDIGTSMGMDVIPQHFADVRQIPQEATTIFRKIQDATMD